jgi:hypothetical protein
MRARELRYEHVGAHISWLVPDPEALFPAETPTGTLEWLCYGPGEVLISVTFRDLLPDDDPAPEYDTERIDGHRYRIDTADYPLHPDTTVTIHPEQDTPA